MDKIKLLKFKTGALARLSHIAYTFNRRVTGVKATYNLNYCGDGKKYHTLDVMRPASAENSPCMVYFHGGGWTAYDKCVFRSTCKRFASYGVTVFNCNFRLAPKFGFEDMLQDIASVLDFVAYSAHRFGGDPEKIIFAGDSAGAHLLSLYLSRAIAAGDKTAGKVIGCAYFYGVYDLAALKGVKFKNMDEYLAATLPENTPDYEKKVEEYSPINFVSDKLPPTLVCSGEVDPLYEGQTAKYLAALGSAGVRVQSLIFPKEFKRAKHKYITFDKNPAAKKSFEAFGEFLKTLK